MTIKSFKISFPGSNDDIKPRFGHLWTTNTLAQVAAAGFLNPYMKSQGFVLFPSDIIFVAASDGTQIYKPVFTGTSVQLTVLP